MPSSNGVYSLPVGYLAVTGTTIQASQHNPPLEDIAAALTLRLSRDGTAPMTGAIQFVSGTVSLPGAVFQADASSGFYKTTNGIGVAIGGQKVAEFLTGGVAGARILGELFPYTGSTAAPLTVIPVGQTLSRVTYAALWAFAQIEIAAGNTFYNNGDGSTTFGIGDMRGCVAASLDPTSTVLTTATITGGPAHIGNKGGAEMMTLLTANLPPYTPSVSQQPAFQFQWGANPHGSGGTPAIDNIANSVSGGTTETPTRTADVQMAAQGGTSTPFGRVQPTLMTNYLLFAGA